VTQLKVLQTVRLSKVARQLPGASTGANDLLAMLEFTAKQVTGARQGIHDAVRGGNVHMLEAMVRNGASINECDANKDHFTALHWACHVGALEV